MVLVFNKVYFLNLGVLTHKMERHCCNFSARILSKPNDPKYDFCICNVVSKNGSFFTYFFAKLRLPGGHCHRTCNRLSRYPVAKLQLRVRPGQEGGSASPAAPSPFLRPASPIRPISDDTICATVATYKKIQIAPINRKNVREMDRDVAACYLH